MSVTASDAYADTWTRIDTWASPRSAIRNDTWTRTIQLPASPVACGAARDHVRQALAAWGEGIDEARAQWSDATHTVILLTSELVTNAITHGASPVTVAVSWSGGQVRVEVHDRSRFLPAPWPVIDHADDETGRGLLLVDTLATDWGFYRTPGGKAVYFTLDCPLDR